ncbi:hypothetical protein LZ31DRAFT_81773 [Colletotrichum somersetense]|nr:hypothetical protein LZ31DRAFT_81773 [Colletotrichum somersetense]
MVTGSGPRFPFLSLSLFFYFAPGVVEYALKSDERVFFFFFLRFLTFSPPEQEVDLEPFFFFFSQVALPRPILRVFGDRQLSLMGVTQLKRVALSASRE